MEDKKYRTDYFVYKGVSYGVGTKVIFTDQFYYKYYYTDDAKDKAYTFVSGFNDGVCLFHWDECNDKGSIFNSMIELLNPDEDIQKIIHPIYANLVPWQYQAVDNIIKRNVKPDIFGGCFLYAAVMIVGILFIDRWLIWIASTTIFINWLLKQYRI